MDTPADGPFPKGNYADAPGVKPLAFNIMLAKMLVAAARKDLGGRPIKLTFEYPAIPECRVAVDKLAEAFRIAGVEIEPVEVPESRLETELRAGRRFDLAYRVLRCDDPILEAGPLLCPAYDAPPETDPLASAASPEILQLLLLLERAGEWPTARGLAIQIDRESRDELAVIPLWQLADHYAWRSRLQGPGPTADHLYRPPRRMADPPVDRPGPVGHAPEGRGRNDEKPLHARNASVDRIRRPAPVGPGSRSPLRSSSSSPRRPRPARNPRAPAKAAPAGKTGEPPPHPRRRLRRRRPRRNRPRRRRRPPEPIERQPYRIVLPLRAVIRRRGSTRRGGPTGCATGRCWSVGSWGLPGSSRSRPRRAPCWTWISQGLEKATPAQAAAFEKAVNAGSYDKVWVVHADEPETGPGVVFSGREYDTATRRLGPLQRADGRGPRRCPARLAANSRSTSSARRP